MVWNVLAPRAVKSKPQIPDGTRIYAIGDVHGRVDLLREMFSAIDDSLISHPIDNVVQVLIGDYIDRGPSSREVIDDLIARGRRHTMVCLKGNHENYAIRFIADPSVLSEWKQVGGMSTLLSYGLRPTARDDPETRQEMSAAFRSTLPESHRRFLQNLPLTYSCGDYFFAHAGVRPGVPLVEQREQDLLWIREDFAARRGFRQGHRPRPYTSQKADVRPNRINIDTGAFATGRLTCLVLQGDEMAVI